MSQNATNTDLQQVYRDSVNRVANMPVYHVDPNSFRVSATFLGIPVISEEDMAHNISVLEAENPELYFQLLDASMEVGLFDDGDPLIKEYVSAHSQAVQALIYLDEVNPEGSVIDTDIEQRASRYIDFVLKQKYEAVAGVNVEYTDEKYEFYDAIMVLPTYPVKLDLSDNFLEEGVFAEDDFGYEADAMKQVPVPKNIWTP